MSQAEMMVSLDDLVPQNHLYRKFMGIWNFRHIDKQLQHKEKDNPYKGYGLPTLFRCLLLQFMEDLSDRELQRYLQENNTVKWFCGFRLCEKTPDYSVFSKVRSRLGTKFIAEIFAHLRNQLKEQGFISEIFTFVDSSHLISKANLWKERDKAIKEKHDKLNNEILPKIAVDKQARMGSKGDNKHWYGYKKHVSVDMQSGLINKVAVTPSECNRPTRIKACLPHARSSVCRQRLLHQTCHDHRSEEKNSSTCDKEKQHERQEPRI